MGGSGSARVVILGGGFGGLTVAAELAHDAGAAADITVVDREPQFYAGLA